MSYRYMVKLKWGTAACALFRAFGDRAFSPHEANTVSPVSERRGMFAALRNNGCMQIANGEKRAHYKKWSKKTMWKFTPDFITYMQNGGLETLETDSRDWRLQRQD